MSWILGRGATRSLVILVLVMLGLGRNLVILGLVMLGLIIFRLGYFRLGYFRLGYFRLG